MQNVLTSDLPALNTEKPCAKYQRRAGLMLVSMFSIGFSSAAAAGERFDVVEVNMEALNQDMLRKEAETQVLQPLIAPTRSTSLPASSTSYPPPTQIIPVLEIPEEEVSGEIRFLTELPELSEAARKIQLDASHRLADEVEIKSVWVFSTPGEKIESKRYAALSNPVPEVRSTLSHLNHLNAKALTPEVWAEAARIQKLPVESVYAVALQESGLRTPGGKFQPWPWTLNCNAPCPHGALRFADKQSASAALNKLLKAGWKNIDIGAMQVNYRAHGKRFSGLDLLDARVNVIVGSVILKEALQQASGNLRDAYALYHVGSFNADNQDRADKYASSVTRWAGHVKTRQLLLAAR
ncbi:MAG: hypothetical protein LW629_07590 [Burkholderiales bacterium]|jgi:hypothetical protein|nr:hypothetical protein [Burkholderiales bacterium]